MKKMIMLQNISRISKIVELSLVLYDVGFKFMVILFRR